jgi:hypothetical protein
MTSPKACIHWHTDIAPDSSCQPMAYPGFFLGRGSTNSVEDRGQRERGSGGGSPLVKGSTQFANELNLYSDYVVMDVYSTELGIRLSFVKTSELGGFEPPKHPSVRHWVKPTT